MDLVKGTLKDVDFQKNLLWFNGLLPAAMLLFDFWTGKLGANPPEAIIRTTGVVALIWLVLALAVTPVAQIMSWGWLIRHRRWLGLWSFYYALIHLLSYSVFDKGFSFADITADIIKRPFILLGFLAFLLMLPLAITSTNDMIKRLGNKRWKQLHRLTYVAAILGVIHFGLIVKSDFFYPIIFTVIVAMLMSYRIVKKILAPRK